MKIRRTFVASLLLPLLASCGGEATAAPQEGHDSGYPSFLNERQIEFLELADKGLTGNWCIITVSPIEPPAIGTILHNENGTCAPPFPCSAGPGFWFMPNEKLKVELGEVELDQDVHFISLADLKKPKTKTKAEAQKTLKAWAANKIRGDYKADQSSDDEKVFWKFGLTLDNFGETFDLVASYPKDSFTEYSRMTLKASPREEFFDPDAAEAGSGD